MTHDRPAPQTAFARAAEILRAILAALPGTRQGDASYLRGYADGLERRRRPPEVEPPRERP